MKKLLLSLIFLFYISALKAQDEFLGKSKQSIVSMFVKKDNFVADAGITSDKKMTFSTWMIDEYHNLFFYYDRDDICGLCISMFKGNDEFFDSLKDLNGKYDKIKNYAWVNKEATIEITLNRNDNGFNIVYKKLY